GTRGEHARRAYFTVALRAAIDKGARVSLCSTGVLTVWTHAVDSSTPGGLRMIWQRACGACKQSTYSRVRAGLWTAQAGIADATAWAAVSGQISIDGVDIHSLSRSHLRKALSLVAQDPFVWHASIRSNLDPEEVHADAEIWVALDRVGMSDAVAELPEKLDTVLEDGGSLSKGQMQLLCLSRVLLRRRKIVVLDEASSSLDLHTDEKIRAVIRTELSDCTVIAVAHRIATIVDFDVILVMDDGELVEHGTPEDLLARPDSRFARLAASQGIVRKQLQ
ncbi:hypothetical protein EVJ58_g10787, partial [Rhodofomes roseus]